MPLHPALVHLPIGLALVLGPLLLGLLWFERGAPGQRGPWWAGAVLACVLAVSALAASSAGEDEALRLAQHLPAAALAAHDDAAGLFTGASVLVALLALASGVAAQPRPRRSLQVVSALVALLLLPLAWRAGQAGGALVWKHGAASSGVDAGGASTAPR
jgi:uncharacterized membrane protein